MRLQIKKNDELIETYVIRQKDVLYLGRSKINDIVLRDPYVSRKHAKIFFDSGQWFVEDLNSDNGVKIKGQKIQKKSIHIGDTFHIGMFSIQLEAELTQNMTIDPNDPHAIDEFSELTPAIPMDSKARLVDQFSFEADDPKTQIFQDADSEKTRIQLSGTETQKPSPQKASDEMKQFLAKQSPSRLQDAPESHLADFEGANDEKTMVGENDALPEPKRRRLVALDGSEQGKEIELSSIEKTQIVIGSDTDADINVKNPNAVGRKATLIINNENTVILEEEDVDPSANTSIIVGDPKRRRELHNHDIIQIGDERFEYLDNESEAKFSPKRSALSPFPLYFFHHPWLDSWVVFFVLGIGLGSFIHWTLKPGKPEQKTLSSSMSPKSKNTSRAAISDEDKRLILFHISHAQNLLEDKQYGEAEVSLNLALQKDPQNKNALTLMQKLNEAREEEKQSIRKIRLALAKTHTKIRELLEKGDRLVAKKDFSQAKKVYEEALNLEPENVESLAALKHLEAIQEEENRVGVAKKNERTQVRRMFNQGIADYEAGKFKSAKKLLGTVVKQKNHPYLKPAQAILKEMSQQNSGLIETQVKAAESLMDSGKLSEAHQRLERLKTAYPQNTSVEKRLKEVSSIMEGQAKAAYREGLTLLEIANDPSAALDQFEKAQKLAPGKNSEYYKKSAEKIKKLTLEP